MLCTHFVTMCFFLSRCVEQISQIFMVKVGIESMATAACRYFSAIRTFVRAAFEYVTYLGDSMHSQVECARSWSLAIYSVRLRRCVKRTNVVIDAREKQTFEMQSLNCFFSRAKGERRGECDKGRSIFIQFDRVYIWISFCIVYFFFFTFSFMSTMSSSFQTQVSARTPLCACTNGKNVEMSVRVRTFVCAAWNSNHICFSLPLCRSMMRFTL